MISKLTSFYIQYVKGLHLNSPFIIIESDDWGSIRIPDVKTYESLKKRKIDVFSNPFNRMDTLENGEDLNAIYEVLHNVYKDTGKKVCITANTVVANPLFNKIESDNFNDYHFENFLDTYKSYGYNKSWDEFQKLYKAGFFMPQFHAREHVNVMRWLRLLRANNHDFRVAFDCQVFSIDFKNADGKRENLLPAYWYQNEGDRIFIEESIQEGLQMFNNIFGFPSTTTIAPVGIWDYSQEKVFASCGINSLQSFIIQKIPDNEKLQVKYRYFGQINENKLRIFPRNVFFEPSTDNSIDWVAKAFNQIERAFLFKRPAVISTHRINYVGGLDPGSRDENLKNLNKLIRKVISVWPEVRFISSDKIMDII